MIGMPEMLAVKRVMHRSGLYVCVSIFHCDMMNGLSYSNHMQM